MTSFPNLHMITFVQSRQVIVRIFAIFLGLFAVHGRILAIDDNATKQIWKLKYGVADAQVNEQAPYAGWLNKDDDGDGIKNKDEIAAGTNPFSAGSAAKITAISVTSTTVNLTFSTEIGKQYVVQGTPAMTAAFSVLSPSVTWIGTGGSKTLTNITKGPNKYFRILVQDIDTDLDGVSNWAETVAGLNPGVAETVSGLSTLAYVNQQLALPSNTVTITPSAPFASEDGPTAGMFTITRSQSLLPISVSYNLAGTAIFGTDYAAISPTTVNFSTPGVSSMDVTVTPTQLAPATIKGSRSVTATLQAPGGGAAAPPFSLGANSSATVIINPSTVPTGTGLLARYYDTSSSTQADAANFGQLGTYAFTRGTPATTGSIVVTPANPAHFAGLLSGNQVKLTFTSGSSVIDNATFDHQNYTVTAVGATTFTVSITSATTFSISTTNGNCAFSIQTFPQIATVTRVDPTVNFDWAYGTPNDVSLTPVTVVDNYSTVYEGYLSPTTAGSYRFQLDADDKARVLVDLNNNGTFELPGEQVVEHGWDTLDGIPIPEVVGTFKIGASNSLVVPAGAAQRYKIRIEHVETTDSARCRVQWSRDGGLFANIPSTNLFTHATASAYIASSGTVTVTTPTAHNLVAGTDAATLWFSSGTLVGQATNYGGTYPVITTPTTTTFTVAIAGVPTQATSAAVQWGNSASTTAGMIQSVYANTSFSGGAGSVTVQAAGPNQNNNGIFGAGTPDSTLIAKDNFSARWTGQVQPQFSEDYTFVVQADDSCALWINGLPQVLKTLPSSSSSGSTYTYSAATGNLVVTYSGLAAVPGSFIVGETTRLAITSGNLNHAPASPLTYDYDPATGNIVVDYTNLLSTRSAGSYVVGEIVEIDPSSGSLSPLANLPYPITAVAGNTFTVNAGALTFTPTTNIASIAPATNCQITTALNHGLTTGATIRISGVSGGTFTTPINGLQTVTVIDANTFSVLVECTGAPVTGTGKINALGTINLNDTRDALITAVTPTTFTANIGTNKYADGSSGAVSVEIANKSLKEWSLNTNERYVRIPMIGGVRYDIRLDYYDNTGYAKCLLSWFSPSQSKQIIPAERLYPTPTPIVAPTAQLAPTALVTPTDATALVGGLFTHRVGGSNGATVTISGNPAWLTYNPGTGLLSGTPPVGAAGDYQITITITNGAGTSTSVLNLHVDANAGSVVREYWSSVSGTSVASIPTSANPTGSANLTTLEAPTGFGINYGARIRGYITAPVTGNYYFWIAANNAAELWISNDDEPVNALKRAWVTTGSTAPQAWSTQATQKTPWLALEQGKKYYVEILHKAGTAVELGGSGNDNLAVGWAKPGDVTTAPSEVVPGYVLSPYVAPAVGSTPGTLYLASMLAQAPAVSNGVGTSTLRLSDDETVAYMRFSASGLSGSVTNKHIHIDPNPGHNDGEIVYDIDTPATSGDGLITNPNDPNYGAYKWTILPVGTYTAASQILDAIKGGKAYINLHTVSYGAGEIRGNYTLANGTRTFSAPPAPPAWTDDSGTDNGAARFLGQASFGANTTDIASFKLLSATGAVPASGIPNSRYNTWIENQFLIAPTQHLTEVLSRELAEAFGPFDVKLSFNTWWKTSMTAPDQLRQRVAFALSQIHVVSGQGPLEDNSVAISDFYDTLAANAFGNFRDILVGTTMTPGMGRYLDMLGNDKPDLAVGRSPNENYAREIKQLFSIGLYRMWLDGTLVLDSSDSPVPTYTQREIVGFAHVFTGWYYGYDGDYRTSFSASANWTRPMREVPARHFTGPKRILNNEVLPGLATVGGQPLDAYSTHISAQYYDPTYEALASEELNAAHDQLFNHPNVGPFICRQLIQRLVTSSPSRDYLYRVVQKFNNNGSGVRGDMKAVIKAILLDNEARSTAQAALPVFGKQREPILRVAQAARTLRPVSPSGEYAQTGATFSGTVNSVVYTGRPIITVTTATAHLLEVGNSVFLEFTDATLAGAKPAPTAGTYTVLSVPSTTTYTIAAPGWISGSYNQTSGSNVMTVTLSGHWLPGVNASQPSLPNANWGQAYFDFTTGTAHNLAGFDQTTRTVQTSTSFDTPSGVGNVSGTTFTITAPDTTARSGNVMIARFSGSYRCTVKAGDITIDTVYGATGTYGTMADHGLSVGDQVFINFANSRDTTSFDETSTENDLVYTITSVPDPNTFTVQARDATNAVMATDNQAFIFPFKAQPLVRNGSIVTRQSTFNMNNTDSDLQQTPLNSTTVFNYFLPDYKFAGSLASQGLTTPEFQLTSETTVIRQSNYLYNGVFNPGNASISSFNAGTNALVLDLSPWMGNAVSTAGTVGAVLGAGPQTGQKWTSNANLPTLIDRMNTLLLGGSLRAGTKTEIVKFLNQTITSVTTGSPCTINVPGHGLSVGDTITIVGSSGGTFSGADTNLNGTFLVSAIEPVVAPAVSGWFRLRNTANTTNLNCTSTVGLSLTSAYFSTVAYTDSGPSTTEIRDRLRSVLHFILTSPDYTIQR